jgi:hypothetical protein
MKNQAEYESNECVDYPKTSSNHYWDTYEFNIYNFEALFYLY